MQLDKIFENHWYKKINFWLTSILLPLSYLFFIISRIRFYLYHFKILTSYKLPVPLAIIGNISVGGVGKTPLTKYLASELSHLGIEIGVISRGYRSQIPKSKTHIVNATDDSNLVGDEALIYAQNGIKVAIGANRYQAGLTLLEKYPNIKLILADDGLQHYRLQRDYEIAVIDANRIIPNQHVLPMGPLRENIDRLNHINAIVISNLSSRTEPKIKNMIPKKILLVKQKLVLDKIYNPITQEIAHIKDFNKKNTIAIAAIGNPERFFDFLRSCGISFNNTLTFPDHYAYLANDIPNNYAAILVTEKDYTKLARLNNDKIWVVLVKPRLDTAKLVEQLKDLVYNIKN